VACRRLTVAAFALLAGCAGPVRFPELVTIPPGVVTFGSRDGEHFRQRDEMPQRTVHITAPFAVSKHEITRAQYAAFVESANYPVGGDCLTDRAQRGDWVYDANTTFRDPGFSQDDDHPVACVSFDDARAYVAWLNARSDGGYRLLTEVEWEYVASAGVDTTYPWGNSPGDGCTQANGFDQTIRAEYASMETAGYSTFDPLPCSDAWLNTSPVGTFQPNRFGVHDMIGNVSEWVEDCYTASHDALGGGAVAAPGVCSRRIAKGGSWGTLAHNLRTADRFPYAATHRDDSIGIRVAKTLKRPQ
jgi:formylglycine-generating enzyme required for sulfatase activity